MFLDLDRLVGHHADPAGGCRLRAHAARIVRG
jgi:hypothetical protein